MFRIAYVFADNPREWNCSEWRCVVPANAINRIPEQYPEGVPDDLQAQATLVYIQDFAERNEKAHQICLEADVIIIQRLVLANMIARILEYEALGKLVLGDVDDSYHLMPPTVNAYKFWHEGYVTVEEHGKTREAKMSIVPIRQLEWGMRIVHGVSAPSEVLLKDWTKFQPVTHLIPNFINAEAYLPHKSSRAPNGELVLGWGGSYSHTESWAKSTIIEALRKVVERNPQVVVSIAGDERNCLALGLPQKNVRFHPWTTHDKWPEVLATFDVGLIPLSGPYDNRRSWLKSLEYTLMGIPWVGTKAPPTEALAAYGYQTANSVEAWRRALQQVIDDYPAAKARVDAGYEYACKQDIRRNAQWLVAKYRAIKESIR